MKLFRIVSALAITLISFNTVLAREFYPTNYSQPRVVELFSSGTAVTEGTATTILARVRGTIDNTMLRGEQLRLQMDGGDSQLDDYIDGSYTTTDAQDTVFMDHICFNHVGGTVSGNLRSRDTGSNFGAVSIQPYGTACGSDSYDSGWYIAKLFAPSTVKISEEQTLRVTDLFPYESTPPEATLTLLAIPTTTDALVSTISAMPLTTTPRVTSAIGVVVFARDLNGIGISCAPDSATNGEMASEAGCSTAINGYNLSANTGLTLNEGLAVAPSRDPIFVHHNTTTIGTRSVICYSRGNGTNDPLHERILFNLGGGAYFMVVQTPKVAGASYIDIRARHTADGFGTRVNLNVQPLTLRTYF